MKDDAQLGQAMHDLATELFPLCRSITGDGIRETLRRLAKEAPFTLHEVPTGTQAFDWKVPKEWNIREAYIEDASGKRIVDFKDNNLHVVGYSVPVDAQMSLAELQEHLHSLPAQPDAIPYVTSYYEEAWGFCLTDRARKELKEGTYHVRIDSDLKDGSLTYAELLIPGESKEEIFLSSYACHPSMANNELSGPVVLTYLAKWLQSAPRRYSYRLIIIPETIGSLTYLGKNLQVMKERVIAGFNVTCVGDDRAYSYLPSRLGGTLADRAAIAVLEKTHPDFKKYSYLDRGGDERQYCSPGIDLPVVSVMRSKYGTYPEYHTSLDDLDIVTPSGFFGGYDALRQCLELLEANRVYRATTLGEPQLGRRGLYAPGAFGPSAGALGFRDILAYADGTNDVVALCAKTRLAPRACIAAIEALKKADLLKEEEPAT
jgi:aminopeptidase-like protein